MEVEEYRVKIIRDSDTRVAYIELWRLGNDFHREGAPARIKRDRKTGAVLAEFWSRAGIGHHREDGPAVIRYRPDGSISYSVWYLDGKKIKPPSRPSRPGKSAPLPPTPENG